MFAVSNRAACVGYCYEKYIGPSISVMNDLLSVPKRFQEVLPLFESHIGPLDVAVDLCSSLVDSKAPQLVWVEFCHRRVCMPCHVNGARV